MRRGKPVFATDTFHAAVGHLLCEGTLEAEARNVIIDGTLMLQGDQGGFLSVRKDYVKKFPKLGVSRFTPMIPEVYSSYYSYFLLDLLGHQLSRVEKTNLGSWVLAHQKSSGAVFNAEYSNTPEERRMESEVAAQTYFATELILVLSPELRGRDVDSSLSRIQNWIHHRYPSLKTVAGRYFSIKALHRIAPEEIVNLGVSETLGFLEDRKSLGNDGFYDYRLQDKTDEAMTTGSLTELDKISSHVFSTYYAASIAKLFSGGSRSSLVDHSAIRLLVSRAANTEGGFGMKVLVKDFEEPYGPTSTELETLLVALFPALLSV
jgi:hypothetical protein